MVCLLGFCWFPDGDQAVIFQTSSTDRMKKECQLSSPHWMHYPSLHIRRGAPGVFLFFWGSTFFWGWFMRVHVLFSGMSVESCWIRLKVSEVHQLDGSLQIIWQDLTWLTARTDYHFQLFLSTLIAGQVMIPDPGSVTELVIPDLAGTQYPGQFSCSRVARMTDRSINRILSLPIFDDEFNRALRLVHLDHVEFWLAVIDDRSTAVDSKIATLISAPKEDQDAKDLLMRRLDLLTMLAHLIESSRPRIEGEIATDLGFGMSLSSAKSAQPDRNMRAPVHAGGTAVVVPAKRPAPSGSHSETSSLQREEQMEKTKWAQRLKQIARKAGDAAKINDTSCMPGVSRAEQDKMKTLVFEAGGFRTIRQNVRAWEKFDEWAAHWQLNIYPPDTGAIVKYCMYLSQEGCGPAVIPSFRYAVSWICRRLVMTSPDLKHGGIAAIEAKVHEGRGKELKEAIPVSLKLVGALENLLVSYAGKEDRVAATVFLFWILILIYGSLRFDDGRHDSSDFPHFEGRGSLWPYLANKGREEEEGYEVRYLSAPCLGQIGSKRDGRLFSLSSMIATFSSGIWWRRRSLIESPSHTPDLWPGWSFSLARLSTWRSRPTWSRKRKERSSRQKCRSRGTLWGWPCCRPQFTLEWTTRPSVCKPTGKIQDQWFWSTLERGRIFRSEWWRTWLSNSGKDGHQIQKNLESTIRSKWWSPSRSSS